MARAWLEKSITDGCSSWDKVLLKLLGLVLMSAVAGRAGDVSRSEGYKGTETLCWGDIELQLSPDLKDRSPSVQDLRGKLTLRFTKYKKQVVPFCASNPPLTIRYSEI
jgi:hypothetical protein